MKFGADANGNAANFGTIIERDGVWYVDDLGTKAKYRPYEAPLSIPNVYLIHELARVRFVDEAEVNAMGTCAGVENGVATYRLELAPELREQMRNMLAQLSQATQQNPKILDDPKLREQVRQMNDMLKNGVARRVDTNLGITVDMDSAKFRLRVNDFHWLDNPSPAELNVEGTKWDDQTTDITTGDRNDLLMISNSALWKPGEPAGDMNACYMDIKSSRLRRIPYHGVQSTVGCFSKDRKKIYVTGFAFDSGSLKPFEIDLASGAQRRLGGDAFNTGMALMPVLSPDGKSLVITHKDPAHGEILEWQMYIIDIASGASKPLGKPMDTAFYSWLPDQSGFVMVTRDNTDMNKPSIDTISRIDMAGNITPIRKGRDPILMDDGKTILYEDPDEHVFKTCDLAGQNVKLFGDGYPGHGFARISPEGKRILLMKFDKQHGPMPLIFNIGETTGKPLTDMPGLWAMPAWK
jgi:hypothetical protein